MADYKEFDTKTITILNSVLAVVSDIQNRCEKLERENSKISDFQTKLDKVLTKMEITQ